MWKERPNKIEIAKMLGDETIKHGSSERAIKDKLQSIERLQKNFQHFQVGQSRSTENISRKRELVASLI